MLRYVDQRDLDVEENRDSKRKYEEDEDDDEEVEGTPRGGERGGRERERREGRDMELRGPLRSSSQNVLFATMIERGLRCRCGRFLRSFVKE